MGYIGCFGRRYAFSQVRNEVHIERCFLSGPRREKHAFSQVRLIRCAGHVAVLATALSFMIYPIIQGIFANAARGVLLGGQSIG